MNEYIFWFSYGLLLVGLAVELGAAVRNQATATPGRSRWTSVRATALGVGFSLQLIVFIAHRDPFKITAAAVALILVVGLTVLVHLRGQPRNPSQPGANVQPSADGD